MKFITEYDLRTKFIEHPFTEYQIEENTKLTPGARQFLSDQKINLVHKEKEVILKEVSFESENLMADIKRLEADILECENHLKTSREVLKRITNNLSQIIGVEEHK